MEDQPTAAPPPTDAAAATGSDDRLHERIRRREQRALERGARRGGTRRDDADVDAADAAADPTAAEAAAPANLPDTPPASPAAPPAAAEPLVAPPRETTVSPRGAQVVRAVPDAPALPRPPRSLPSPAAPAAAPPGRTVAPPQKQARAMPVPMPGVPVAGPARLRPRHAAMGVSFVVLVVLPSIVAAWYLWVVALDQYASRVGFSVQREESGSAIELLGGITQLSGSSSTDTDILYKYIQSRDLITTVDARLDLVAMFTRPEDPLYSMAPNPTIEDIEDQWGQMVDIFYDTASHLLEVRVRAFRPEDATAVATAILEESTLKLNEITSTGRADATRYAREELDQSKARLRDARQALTAFRIRTQIVDPLADVQGRMGLLNNLLSQQAMALIELDLVAATASPNDPRMIQAQRRVEVIEARLREERARFGDQPAEEDARYADLVAEYEELSADVEFAQQAYLTAVATYDSAVAEAQRKSRYLATYLPPTQAERSQFPQRGLLFAIFAGAAFAIWALGVLVYYTLRDRI